jgi:hypothetical protein
MVDFLRPKTTRQAKNDALVANAMICQSNQLELVSKTSGRHDSPVRAFVRLAARYLPQAGAPRCSRATVKRRRSAMRELHTRRSPMMACPCAGRPDRTFAPK